MHAHKRRTGAWVGTSRAQANLWQSKDYVEGDDRENEEERAVDVCDKTPAVPLISLTPQMS